MNTTKHIEMELNCEKNKQEKLEKFPWPKNKKAISYLNINYSLEYDKANKQ